MNQTEGIFFSYSRVDGDFARKLAADLRKSGIDLWMDQLDIDAGERWDQAIERALESCPILLVILSEDSVKSHNVMDEVSYALEEKKRVIPFDFSETGDLGDGFDFDINITDQGKVELVQAVACPWVYVRSAGTWVRRVEIIQNLRGKEKETTQRVRLGTVIPERDGELTLRIQEELEEVSYIDQLTLELDGSPNSIFPTEVSLDINSLIDIDGTYVVLRQNDLIEVTFFDKRFKQGTEILAVISATGYYDTLAKTD